MFHRIGLSALLRLALVILGFGIWACCAQAATWYISPSGSDTTGTGTSANPWQTPNHSGLTCGDTIYAAPGTYPYQVIVTVTPSCPAQDDFVRIICTTLHECMVNYEWDFHASYWGLIGFMGTNANVCFNATAVTQNIGNIVFLENICNGSQYAGISIVNTGNYRVGNIAIIGNIVYNSSQTSIVCGSGISVGGPGNFLPSGDEIYVAYNFSYGNMPSGSSCNNGGNSDNSGLTFDTFDGYSGWAMAEYNWLGWNGGPGFEVVTGDGKLSNSWELARYNTMVSNAQWPEMVWSSAVDFLGGQPGVGVQYFNAYYNIAQGTTNRGPAAMYLPAGNGPGEQSLFDMNFDYNGVTGEGDQSWATLFTCMNSTKVGPFSGQTNVGCTDGDSWTTDPQFRSLVEPGPPTGCSGESNFECFYTAEEWNLQPQNTAAQGYGADATGITDEFNNSAWLCKVYASTNIWWWLYDARGCNG